MSFLGELKRRNVVRMALLYVVAGWVLLQIADVLFDPLGLPEWTFRLVFGLLLLGFPFALIFAWVFELTPEGLKRERDIDPGRSVVQQTGNKMNVAIIVLLVLAIAGLVVDRVLPERSAGPERGVGSERAAAPAGEPQAVTVQEPVAAEPPAAADEGSIAVLPFVNMSGDPENEYFSDGLSEELLNTLVRIGGLKVTGRTSSFAFKGRNQDLREIGRLLNVANVLEGSVRKAGDRVRITAQLIKTSDGYHLWSDSFDRQLDDIFAIQQEIAEQVTRALQVTLLGESPGDRPAATFPSSDPQAYEEYLRGMYIWQRFPDDRDSLIRARAHFEKAIELDAEYVDAYWGMYLFWDRMNRNGHVPFIESKERMQQFAEELSRLAPGSDRALSAAARNALVNYRYAEGRGFLAEAVERYPSNATVWSEYAASLVPLGQFDEALQAVSRAAELDPLSLEILRWKSFVLYVLGDCDGAAAAMQRALEFEPGIGRFRYYAAMCIYETTGDVQRALPLAQAEPVVFLHDTALAIFYNALGDAERAQERLDHMRANFGETASYQYGQIHAQWGDMDLALNWLEKAVEIHDTGITQAGYDRLLDPLRGEPRFQQILRDSGYP
jgi:serine/threonine-protein kinase